MRALRRAAMLAQLVARPAIWRKGCARFRAGLVVLRPPPAARSPTPLTLNTRGPGFVLGRVTSAPLQSARLFTRQLLRLDLADLERHAMLVGTTGAGKTTSLSRLMDASMSAGWAVLVVDAKGGRLASVCRALGASHGLPARVWLPGHPDSWTYDPCAGEPTAVADYRPQFTPMDWLIVQAKRWGVGLVCGLAALVADVFRDLRVTDGGPSPVVFEVLHRGTPAPANPWGVWRDGEPRAMTVADSYVLVYLLWLNWRLTLFVAVLGPLVALMMRALTRRTVGLRA